VQLFPGRAGNFSIASSYLPNNFRPGRIPYFAHHVKAKGFGKLGTSP
jgi:hypothetical protein